MALFTNAATNDFSVAIQELLPTVCPSVTGIDAAITAIKYKEETSMIVIGLPSTDKDSVIALKDNQVIKLEFRIVNFGHGKSPSVLVVIRELVRVDTQEVGFTSPLLATIAANPKPATVSRKSGWVKFVVSCWLLVARLTIARIVVMRAPMRVSLLEVGVTGATSYTTMVIKTASA
jgi:hypothetical protein